jgi:uncharacterized membrane protein required for colicin V production
MNWIDIVIVLIVAASLVWGLKTGVIPMVFTVVGMLIGWWLAGQYADDVGALVGDWGTFDTAVTVVCYAAIVSLSVFVASKLGSLVKPFLVIGTLGTAGMADKIGGLLIGLLIGLVITGAFIVVLARLSFDLEVSTPDVQVAGGAEIMRLAGGKVAAITEKRQVMVNSLRGSTVVPVFLDMVDLVPGSALGFIPGDFQASLDILREDID